MKIVIALACASLAVNQWDANYNNGYLTQKGFALAAELARAFGL